MGYLLDTDVISEITRRDTDPRVDAWLDSVPGPSLYVSVMVFGELRQGIERIRPRDPTQAEVCESWLSRVEHSFSDRIVPISLEIAEAWGELGLPPVGGLIAATARVHGWTVATRNVKDFTRTGVRIVNPWEWPV